MKKLLEMTDKMKGKYAELFIAALDSMEGSEWTNPWVSPGLGAPCNLYRRNKPYQGVNAFLLKLLGSIMGFETPYFVTFKEMTDREKKFGGLRLTEDLVTDETGMPVFDDKGMPKIKRPGSFPVFKFLPRFKDKDGNTISSYDYEQMSDDEKGECRKWFNLFTYGVWNIDQTNFRELFPDDYKALVDVPTHEYIHGKTDDVLERMIMEGEWRCPIMFGGHSAHYLPEEDHIRLPQRGRFLSDELFYGTALHEMAHSTAIELKRSQDGAFGSEEYVMEEFVAELTSACVCSMIGVGKLIDDQHLAYVDNWRKAIREQQDFVPRVIDHVQRATNYILRRYDALNKQMHPLALPMAA